MNAAERYENETYDEATGSVLSAAPDVVEVRRNAGVAALVGALASAVAIAYLARAAQTGAVLDWALFGVMAVLGGTHLHAFLDARTPLLLADSQGVRLRLGRAWHGLPWGALATVEHTPRRGMVRDGRLVLVPHNTDRVLAELDSSGRRQSRVSERLYGAPLALPLGLSTRVSGPDTDLTTALRRLAGDATRVLEPVAQEEPVEEPVDPSVDEAATAYPGAAPVEAPRPVTSTDERADEPFDQLSDQPSDQDVDLPERGGHAPVLHDPRPGLAALIARLAAPFQRREPDAADPSASVDDTEATQPIATPVVASATPQPLREPRAGRRSEVRAEVPEQDEETHGRELHRPGSVTLVEDTQVWGDRVRPIARAGDAVDPLVIDDFEVEPAADPVIGPELAAGRTRLGLTVDQLADRTRIRPHVIESIEVDDFAPCGGDFYARGHLRTLARVLGVDAAPLLTTYDERYADAPINPRRVFEAELATGAGGSIRSTKGGPNWSILIAVMMTLVLAWSIARLVMDSPAALQNPSPSLLDGSGGPSQPATGGAPRVTLKVTATGNTHLKIKNGAGKVVFDADVPYGEIHRIDVRPPVVVSASDAGAVDVQVNGNKRGTLGKDGQYAKKTYRVNAD